MEGNVRNISVATVLCAIAFAAFADTRVAAVGLHRLDDIATLCAGGLVLAESALLLLGMNIPTASPWSTPRNLLLASTDIALGGVLAYYALSGCTSQGDWLYYAAAGLLVLTHLYREAEFIAGWKDPFAGSAALFVFNNVRLALVGLSIGLTLSF